MKRLFALLLLMPSLVSAQTVLTHLPVNQMLASELIKDTDISVTYLPPKRYGMTRLNNWFATKVSKQQAQSWATEADAVIGLPSLWPQDPLYPLLREHNIRLIAIDSADPQTMKGNKVAVRQNNSGDISPYVWLNPNNLKTMATIVGRDLSALYPAHADTIGRNQQALLKAIAKQEQANQDWLFDNEVEEVIVVGAKLDDFVYGNNLFSVGRFESTLDQWQSSDWAKLSKLNTDGVTLLVGKKPTKAAAAKLTEMAIDFLLVDTIEKMGTGVSLARWRLAD